MCRLDVLYQRKLLAATTRHRSRHWNFSSWIDFFFGKIIGLIILKFKQANMGPRSDSYRSRPKFLRHSRVTDYNSFECWMAQSLSSLLVITYEPNKDDALSPIHSLISESRIGPYQCGVDILWPMTRQSTETLEEDIRRKQRPIPRHQVTLQGPAAPALHKISPDSRPSPTFASRGPTSGDDLLRAPHAAMRVYICW